MQPGDDVTPADPPMDPRLAAGSKTANSLRMGLYVLPAFVVLVFVAGWLFVFWLLHEDQDPLSLVHGMQQPGRRSWQKAYALSHLLLDPGNDHLKDDVQLCRELSATLAHQNEQAEKSRKAREPEDEELVQFRAFLCRVLGEFRLRDGLPTLLDCAAVDTTRLPADSHEYVVRRAAIEAMAVLADNVGTRTIQADSTAIEVLLTATTDVGLAEPAQRASDVASAATFALGVIGGPQATQRLLELLADTRPDVRYNAATGLARQCRAEAVPVLLEMLDSDRTAYTKEKTESAQARKQLMVLTNGIRASQRLLPAATLEDRQLLVTALRRLCDSPHVSARVRLDAKQVLLKAAVIKSQ